MRTLNRLCARNCLGDAPRLHQKWLPRCPPQGDSSHWFVQSRFVEIQNCFSLGCPTDWDGLEVTDEERTRFCKRCQRAVYCPRYAEELLARFQRGERLAFHPESFPALSALFFHSPQKSKV